MARMREAVLESCLMWDVSRWQGTDRDPFVRHLKAVAAEVETWPAWKRGCLGPYAPTPLTERQSAKDGTLL